MPQGYLTPEAGYFGTEQDGRDTLAALQTYRLTAEKLQAAYQDLGKEYIRNAKSVQEQIKGLEMQINAERRAWKAEVARARTRSVIWVVLAGAAGYAIGR
ncbi:hypothetical protein FACS1894187_10890 [Synergistales bacterium]|nr:hypothetical protein FACS1894187_10890 [Synergistales bacterium]